MMNIIECPRCKKEYLPAEIIIPKYLIDEPTKIIRDASGKILDFDGEKASNIDYYVCDCGCKFKVNSNIKFEVNECDNSNEFISGLREKFILTEF